MQICSEALLDINCEIKQNYLSGLLAYVIYKRKEMYKYIKIVMIFLLLYRLPDHQVWNKFSTMNFQTLFFYDHVSCVSYYARPKTINSPNVFKLLKFHQPVGSTRTYEMSGPYLELYAEALVYPRNIILQTFSSERTHDNSFTAVIQLYVNAT